MDNYARKLLGWTDKHLFFDKEWRIEKECKGVQETLKTISSTSPQPFKKKFTIFHRYQSGISNDFKVSHSNGVTEELNNKIKLIKRIMFSYRTFYNFRVRIYLQQGLIVEN